MNVKHWKISLGKRRFVATLALAAAFFVAASAVVSASSDAWRPKIARTMNDLHRATRRVAALDKASGRGAYGTRTSRRLRSGARRLRRPHELSRRRRFQRRRSPLVRRRRAANRHDGRPRRRDVLRRKSAGRLGVRRNSSRRVRRLRPSDRSVRALRNEGRARNGDYVLRLFRGSLGRRLARRR